MNIPYYTDIAGNLRNTKTFTNEDSIVEFFYKAPKVKFVYVVVRMGGPLFLVRFNSDYTEYELSTLEAAPKTVKDIYKESSHKVANTTKEEFSFFDFLTGNKVEMLFIEFDK